jgi:WD repeat-containing protein 23
MGHVAGITNVSSREDGFYVASNSKDQTLKLWDLRKSTNSVEGKPRKSINFDYRV